MTHDPRDPHTAQQHPHDPPAPGDDALSAGDAAAAGLERTRQLEPLGGIVDPAADAVAGGSLNATQALGIAQAAEHEFVPPPPRHPGAHAAPEPRNPLTDTARRPAQTPHPGFALAPVADGLETGEATDQFEAIHPTAQRDTTGHLTDESGQRVARSTLLMAAGTIFSRLSGFFRSALLLAALGGSVHADIFNVANTVPNMVYILVAGGIFNAVLVPQLVRAMKNDGDGGDAYANRLVTLATLFLGAVTVLLVIFAPVLMDLVLGSDWNRPDMVDQRQSAIDFARFCLPQVFFYGMFVLVGQILNARGSFGPMMWAPIANNVISVAVLIAYLVANGSVGADDTSAFSSGQELFLGLGSTLGIAVQFVVLVPYLRRAGFRFTPRFDFRGTGLGTTMRLGVWTVLFVIVNQAAYLVVTNLATDGAADDGGTGLTIYSSVFIVMMVPHSVVTVSLATALLPRLSALAEDRRLARLGTTLGGGLRQALAVILPFTVLLPVVAGDIAKVAFGAGGAMKDSTEIFVPTMIAFAPAMMFFTVHYLMLRGFYAQEQNRLVFFIQVAVSLTNVVAALALVNAGPASQTAPRLAVAYGCAYAVGATVTYLLMHRRVGTVASSVLARFLVRMLLALAAAACVGLGLEALLAGWGHGWWAALFRGGIAGAGGLVVFVLMCVGLRVAEVTALVDGVRRTVQRRLGHRGTAPVGPE